jgi:hypothetical protein
MERNIFNIQRNKNLGLQHLHITRTSLKRIFVVKKKIKIVVISEILEIIRKRRLKNIIKYAISMAL